MSSCWQSRVETNNQQPTTSNQQPTNNNQQPTTNKQQPTGNHRFFRFPPHLFFAKPRPTFLMALPIRREWYPNRHMTSCIPGVLRNHQFRLVQMYQIPRTHHKCGQCWRCLTGHIFPDKGQTQKSQPALVRDCSNYNRGIFFT